MRHRPIFRWVTAAGLLLVVLGFVVWETGPDYPELELVELTVLEEEPDGTCAVRWTDPYGGGQRTGPYRCDPDRDPLLKDTTQFEWGSLGWDVGHVVAEGDLKGELYDPDVETAADRAVSVSDALTVPGVLIAFMRPRLRRRPDPAQVRPADRVGPAHRPAGGASPRGGPRGGP